MKRDSYSLLNTFDNLHSQWLKVKSALLEDLALGLDFNCAEDSGWVTLVRCQQELFDIIATSRRDIDKLLYDREIVEFENMVYCFVAFIDDQMLKKISWHPTDKIKALKGRDLWLEFLLEYRVFGSRNSSSKLPYRFKFLAESKNLSARQKDLVIVYLKILFFKVDFSFRESNNNLQLLKTKLAGQVPLVSASVDEDVFDIEQYPDLPTNHNIPRRLAPFSYCVRLFRNCVIVNVVIALLAWFLSHWSLSTNLHFFV
jgi:hypothetical protein